MRDSILRVGVTGDYPPFSRRDSERRLVGYSIELMDAVGELANLVIEYVATSWQTMGCDLVSKRFNVAIGGVSITDDRLEKFIFCRPVLEDGKIPLVHRRNQHRLCRLSDIDHPDVTVLVNPGGSNYSFAKTHIQHAKIRVIENIPLLFDELKNGSLSALITDRVEALYRQEVSSELVAVRPESLLKVEKKAFMFRRESTDLRAMIDGILGEHSFRERIVRMKKRWLPSFYH